MNKNKKSKTLSTNLIKIKFNTLEMILIFIMALIFGILIGEMVFKGDSKHISLNTSTNSGIYEIKDVYNTILSEYIGEIDQEKLKEAAINGMMLSLKDKHSMYFNQEESEDFQDVLNGRFTGIGVKIIKEKTGLVTVYEVYPSSPADKAGLKEGDMFLSINNTDVSKSSTQKIADMIKGKKGTFVIEIKRNEIIKKIKITTGQVDLPSVTSKIIEKNNIKIGYIAISVFARNTDEQLKKQLKKLETEKIKNLIVDLRYNQGGELESVIDVTSEFLDKKKPIIQIKTKNRTEIKYSKGNKNRKYNITVLINDSSASGAEATAAALNEQLNAPLIGVTTYGKGTVQKTKQLANGDIIKYTAETWNTSKGKSIEKIGVKPTIELKQNDKYFETQKDEDDLQLQKAIEGYLK